MSIAMELIEGPTLDFQIADAVAKGRLLPPPSHAHVPGWIRDLLERGLASSPEQRPLQCARSWPRCCSASRSCAAWPRRA
ncbi:hypothetical protein [Enhygromyxa salina]|uniref:hypothetical protein n=1 Tax=Enhygromyxa salina TaxID=215803 RepID=UPI0011B1D6F5|nr:hypothetical protein [Enhygromyxa salina]